MNSVSISWPLNSDYILCLFWLLWQCVCQTHLQRQRKLKWNEIRWWWLPVDGFIIIMKPVSLMSLESNNCVDPLIFSSPVWLQHEIQQYYNNKFKDFIKHEHKKVSLWWDTQTSTISVWISTMVTIKSTLLQCMLGTSILQNSQHALQHE